MIEFKTLRGIVIDLQLPTIGSIDDTIAGHVPHKRFSSAIKFSYIRLPDRIQDLPGIQLVQPLLS